MHGRLAIPCAILLLLPGCRDAAERRAAELAALRDDAMRGIEAVETFCTARDSAIAAAERGDAGAGPALAEILLAPVVLDDYCEEFRSHSHDEHDPPAGGTPAPPFRTDSVPPRDTSRRDAGA